MSKILLTRYFTQNQGHKLRPSVIYQDNKSPILPEVNGRGDTPKRTNNTKVRYFFIKDKVESVDVLVKHCPKETMWTDVITKLKQGNNFWEFRATLMNIPVDYNNSDPYAINCRPISKHTFFAKGTKPCKTNHKNTCPLQECVSKRGATQSNNKQKTCKIHAGHVHL